MNTRPGFWQTHFLVVDASIALVMVLGFAVWLGSAEGAHEQVNEVLVGNRQALYGRIATIAGTMMGFGIAVGSFIVPTTTSSERFRLLRGSKYYDQLWKTYTQTVKCFGLLTIISLVCLLMDTDASPSPWGLVPLLFFALLAIFRLLRSLWILELIIKIVSRPTHHEHPHHRETPLG